MKGVEEVRRGEKGEKRAGKKQGERGGTSWLEGVDERGAGRGGAVWSAGMRWSPHGKRTRSINVTGLVV